MRLSIVRHTGSTSTQNFKKSSKLRDLGLVEGTRKEKFVYYTLKKDVELLNMNIQWILENTSDYPLVAIDISKLADKENYYPVCGKSVM